MTCKRPKCRHPFFDRFIATRDVHTLDGQTRMTYEFCGVCGAWMSLGPSDETDPQVALEIRAAELAALYRAIEERTLKGASRFIESLDGAELAGWIERQHDSAKVPEQSGEWAGYLAKCIADHDSATEREGRR